jgi:stage II sporulation protein E
MRFVTIAAIRVEHSKMTSAKQGEVTDGDTVATFESTDGMFYALINDGMGSGEAAAICSRMGAILIEKLVLLGSDRDEVLRLLNKMILSKEDEVFTTVDLLSIDKLLMTAEILKAGAAQSYLVRDGEIMVLSAQSTPLGLVETLSAKRLRFSLKQGDVIVMVSDGAHDSDGVPSWLSDYVNAPISDSVSVMTAKLLERARECAEKPDDVSVVVTRIR